MDPFQNIYDHDNYWLDNYDEWSFSKDESWIGFGDYSYSDNLTSNDEGNEVLFDLKIYQNYISPNHLVNNISLLEKTKISPRKKGKCKYCGEFNFTEENLKNHISAFHQGSSPYICVVCNKRFTTMAAMHKHRTVHSKIKSFVCQICSNQFSQSGNMHRHIRMIHFRGISVEEYKEIVKQRQLDEINRILA